MSNAQLKVPEVKMLKPMSGMHMLLLNILVMLLGIALGIFGFVGYGQIFQSYTFVFLIELLALILFIGSCFGFAGLKIITPNEALVLALFGNYYGTLAHDGFFWINPFCSAINPTIKK